MIKKTKSYKRKFIPKKTTVKQIPPFFETDPYISYQIMLQMDAKKLLLFCQANENISKICASPQFWKDKIKFIHGVEVINSMNLRDARTLYDMMEEPKKNKDWLLDLLYRIENYDFYMEFIKWLKTQDLADDNYYSIANSAAESGQIEILKGLEHIYVFPDVEGANRAAAKGRIEVLDWLEQREILPDVNGANEAAAEGRIEALDWLKDEGRNIFPDIDGANWAAAEGHIEVLDWLEEPGIWPDVDGANWAAAEGHIGVLEWLEERDIFPDVDGANEAANNGWIEVVNWLMEHDIFPND